MDEPDTDYGFNSLLHEIADSPEENKRERYQFLVSKEEGWENLHPSNYLNLTGHLIDISFDLREMEGLERAIELCENVLERDLSSGTRSRAHYQMSNANSHLSNLDPEGEPEDWDNQYLENELIHLRKGLSEDGVQEILDEIECKMYTHLGNGLSRIGRVIEAFEWWNRSLQVEPSHAMAKGNRGVGKYRYATALHDKGHSAIFLASALHDLEGALKSEEIHPSAGEYFQFNKETVEQFVTGDRPLDDLDGFPMGDSEEEMEYRKWCLGKRLFLNPLNDITRKSVAAKDILHLPNMGFEMDEPFPYPGLYNQMKQEFVSARYLYYQGVNSEKPHFSDKDVYLDNTLDYPVYSLATERVKAGLRLSYSIFDKIAFFLNEYLDLGESEDSISFGNIWFKNLQYNQGLKPVFRKMDNWPFQALYWLRKDFYGGQFNIDDSIELIADDLSEIRHHLEHKYLKVHDDVIVGDVSEEPPKGTYKDTPKFSIGRDDLEEAGFRMLMTARAGLIYLSLGVHREELRRMEDGADSELSVPIYSHPIDDDWKV